MVDGLVDNDETVTSCKKQFIHILFMTKIAKIDILFLTKTAQKPYPLGPQIPLEPNPRPRKDTHYQVCGIKGVEDQVLQNAYTGQN